MSDTFGYSRFETQGEQRNADPYVWKNTWCLNHCKTPHDGLTLAWAF